MTKESLVAVQAALHRFMQASGRPAKATAKGIAPAHARHQLRIAASAVGGRVRGLASALSGLRRSFTDAASGLQALVANAGAKLGVQFLPQTVVESAGTADAAPSAVERWRASGDNGFGSGNGSGRGRMASSGDHPLDLAALALTSFNGAKGSGVHSSSADNGDDDNEDVDPLSHVVRLPNMSELSPMLVDAPRCWAVVGYGVADDADDGQSVQDLDSTTGGVSTWAKSAGTYGIGGTSGTSGGINFLTGGTVGGDGGGGGAPAAAVRGSAVLPCECVKVSVAALTSVVPQMGVSSDKVRALRSKAFPYDTVSVPDAVAGSLPTRDRVVLLGNSIGERVVDGGRACVVVHGVGDDGACTVVVAKGEGDETTFCLGG